MKHSISALFLLLSWPLLAATCDPKKDLAAFEGKFTFSHPPAPDSIETELRIKHIEIGKIGGEPLLMHILEIRTPGHDWQNAAWNYAPDPERGCIFTQAMSSSYETTTTLAEDVIIERMRPDATGLYLERTESQLARYRPGHEADYEEAKRNLAKHPEKYRLVLSNDEKHTLFIQYPTAPTGEVYRRHL